jgi:hypothetical protein
MPTYLKLTKEVEELMPELFQNEYAYHLTMLKGILRYSIVYKQGYSEWDKQLVRTDRVLRELPDIDFLRCKTSFGEYSITNVKGVIRKYEAQGFQMPAKKAMWLFSSPKKYPDWLTFRIFPIYI